MLVEQANMIDSSWSICLTSRVQCARRAITRITPLLNLQQTPWKAPGGFLDAIASLVVISD